MNALPLKFQVFHNFYVLCQYILGNSKIPSLKEALVTWHLSASGLFIWFVHLHVFPPQNSRKRREKTKHHKFCQFINVMKEDCELLCRLPRLFIKWTLIIAKLEIIIANKSKRKNIKLTITWLYYSKQFIIISNIIHETFLIMSFSYPRSLKIYSRTQET